MIDLRPLALVAAAALIAPLALADDAESEQAESQGPKVKWISGPKKVDLGSIAELQLPASVAFADKEDAQKLLEHMGNVIGGTELGLVIPKAEDQDWIIVFDYDDIGYIKDAEKEKIDAAALLKSIQEGTEQANEERKKRGHAGLHVTGWAEPPHYDPRTHNLTWAALDRSDDGHRGVNYNVRLLGRSGVMSVTLVDEPDKLAGSKPSVDQVISAFSFKHGSSYAEWKPGDKVAEYGLAGLVAAGAGAAAVKLGLFGALGKLFAKMGKLIVVIVAAVGGAIAKFWRKLKAMFSGRSSVDRSGGPGFGGGEQGPQGGQGGTGGDPGAPGGLLG
jgi:uncharacterized membrane-anchored protein